MKQLTQTLNTGHMEIMAVPFPAMNCREILVRNHFSVISPGTEGKTVKDARKGYISKARSRKEEVNQTINLIKSHGLASAYKMVMNKLETPVGLGYSTAGIVIDIGDQVTSVRVGDRVACGGGSAVHADVISVPENLCVKIPDNVKMVDAAFTTIASIAVQGIRQANLSFGESCVIIGLGLIGRITALLLDAAGIFPIGVDISNDQIKAAIKSGLENAFHIDNEKTKSLINQLTNGIGADAIIIAASSNSTMPVDFAGEIARKKGKIVIVGDVLTGFKRKNYYKKELELKMSTSYGPGRHDSEYELKGHDYPVGYVRWTERRNMESFLNLLARKKLNVKTLITHTFDFPDAKKAYDLINQKSEPFSGIVLRFDTDQKIENEVVYTQINYNNEKPQIGLIGAGSFAKNILLPSMKSMCDCIGIISGSGPNASFIAEKYNFKYSTNDLERLLADPEINTIVIATRHNLHSSILLKTLNKKPNIFIEKPLAINIDDLELIRQTYNKTSGVNLMVGFNRRFSPAIEMLMKEIREENVVAINMLVNAGDLPPEHWVNDKEVGGGRIIGEVCHFIDLAIHIARSQVLTVEAIAMKEPKELNNTICINLKFSNGSIASINYFSNGNRRSEKERIDVFCSGIIYKILNYKSLTIIGKSSKTIRFRHSDKGHKNELKAFFTCINLGLPSPIPFKEIYSSTLITFKVLESIRLGRSIDL